MAQGPRCGISRLLVWSSFPRHDGSTVGRRGLRLVCRGPALSEDSEPETRPSPGQCQRVDRPRCRRLRWTNSDHEGRRSKRSRFSHASGRVSIASQYCQKSSNAGIWAVPCQVLACASRAGVPGLPQRLSELVARAMSPLSVAESRAAFQRSGARPTSSSGGRLNRPSKPGILSSRSVGSGESEPTPRCAKAQNPSGHRTGRPSDRPAPMR